MNCPEWLPKCLIANLGLFPLWLFDESQSSIKESQPRNLYRSGHSTGALGRAQVSLGGVRCLIESVSASSTVDEQDVGPACVASALHSFWGSSRPLLLSALADWSSALFLLPPIPWSLCLFFFFMKMIQKALLAVMDPLFSRTDLIFLFFWFDEFS